MECEYTINRLSERILARRKELQLSRNRMAILMLDLGGGVHLKTIEAWEKGKQLCDLAHIPFICSVLDCDTEYLFGNSPTPHKETSTVTDITGLSQRAVDRIIKHKKTKSKEKLTFSDFLSALIEDKNYTSLAENLIMAANFVNENNIKNDWQNLLWLNSSRGNEDIEEFGLDYMMDVLNGNLRGIDEEQRYKLILTALKQQAMDLYGKFFDCQMEVILQQSIEAGKKGNHDIEMQTMSDALKSREDLNDGKH